MTNREDNAGEKRQDGVLGPVRCPSFTTTEKHIDNASHVDLDFNSDGEAANGPITWTTLTQRCRCLASTNVKLRFQEASVVDC